MAECVALVIGVGAYKHMSELRSASTEAKLMYTGLLDNNLASQPILRHDQGHGRHNALDKYVVIDTSRESLVEAIDLFCGILKEKSQKCWAFLYYAGHGFSVGATQYLCGSDSKPTPASGIPVDLLLLPMRKHAMASLAVFDTCRVRVGGSSDYGTWRSHERHTQGLGGVFICWAASPLEAAQAKSYYSAHLAKYLFLEKLAVHKAVNLASQAVMAEGEQRPDARTLWGDSIDDVLHKPLDAWGRFLGKVEAKRSAPPPSVPSAPSPAELTPKAKEVLELAHTHKQEDLKTVSMGTADIRSLIAAMLESKDARLQGDAALALWGLVCKNDANRRVVAQADGIRPLVQALACPDPILQINVARILGALTLHPGSQETIAKAEGIKALVGLQLSPHSRVREEAAATLDALAVGNLSNKAAIEKEVEQVKSRRADVGGDAAASVPGKQDVPTPPKPAASEGASYQEWHPKGSAEVVVGYREQLLREGVPTRVDLQDLAEPADLDQLLLDHVDEQRALPTLNVGQTGLNHRILQQPLANRNERDDYLALEMNSKLIYVMREYSQVGPQGPQAVTRVEMALKTQVVAGFLAKEFNKSVAEADQEAKRKPGKSMRLEYLPACIAAYRKSDETIKHKRLREPFVAGRMIKFNNNTSYVAPKENFRPECDAFPHWTYAVSGGRLMVTDVQGWVDREARVVRLTDPCIHCQEPNLMDVPGKDRGLPGMLEFFQAHTCDSTCCALGLDRYSSCGAELARLQKRIMDFAAEPLAREAGVPVEEIAGDYKTFQQHVQRYA